MKNKTFDRGIILPHNKTASGSPLAVCPAPERVFIPLSQHIGKPAAAAVSVGQSVKAGSVVGRADGHVSAHIFSSVSGVVRSISVMRTPTGKCEHVEIENDGRYEEEALPVLDAPDREAILERIKAAGLVGMGGAGFPAHVKFSPKSPVDTLLINAAECEPYITCDDRLMVECAASAVRGAIYLAKALGLKHVEFCIEDNKPQAISSIKAAAEAEGADVGVTVLRSKYPQGAEKQLIYAATGRRVPPGKLPADVGVVVGNVHTAFALCEAVEKGRPLYRRAVTVGGGAMNGMANLWVRTGTPLSALAEYCGGVKETCVKLLSGGPMMGIALDGLDYYVTKTTGALLALGPGEAKVYEPGPCINCARCHRACPMRLMPMYIDAYTLRGDYTSAARYGAMDCIECGCCAYVCPAKRPLVQSVRLAKNRLREQKK